MRIWRMAMRVGAGGTSMWPHCRAAGVAAITYEPISRLDLSPYSTQQLPPEWAELEGPQKTSLRRAAFEIQAGDVILVKEGPLIAGRGKVVGVPGARAYQFRPELGLIDENNTPWPHTVPVEWDDNFAGIAISVGRAQYYTVEEIAISEASVLDGLVPVGAAITSSRQAVSALDFPQLDLMIPEYEAGHHPFNKGDHPDFYTPETIKEKKEAVTARSDFFIKTLVAISWAIDGPVPYAFKTRDGKIRSLDAGCLGSLSNRKIPDLSFVLNSQRTIVAVEPSSRRKEMYEPMRRRLLTELGMQTAQELAGNPASGRQAYLAVHAIAAVLQKNGFVRSETKKSCVIGIRN